ncbi:MAG: hypothetical protein R2710_25545 [Acidimicrobiales bacterium]
MMLTRSGAMVPVIDGGAALTLAARSVVVLQAVPPADSSAEGVAP